MADPTPDPAPVPDHLADLRAKAEQLAACGDVMSRELLAAWAATAALIAERDVLKRDHATCGRIYKAVEAYAAGNKDALAGMGVPWVDDLLADNARLRGELDALRAALTACVGRMGRARDILTEGRPRAECNWGMLDASEFAALLAPPPAARLANARTSRPGAEPGTSEEF